jgi:hypothetical protein
MSSPIETEKEIWLPPRYEIVNKVGDVYLKVTEPYKGINPIEISYDQYTFYEEIFNKANHTVTITTDGTVWYAWSSGGVNYVTKQKYGDFHFWRTGSVVNILDNGHIRLYYDREWWLVIMFSVTGILASALISAWAAEKIDDLLKTD